MLKPIQLGLALGILWGGILGLSVLGTLSLGWPGEALYPPLAAIYVGLQVSPLGALVGAVWGFADGFLGGVIFAWLYNLLTKK